MVTVGIGVGVDKETLGHVTGGSNEVHVAKSYQDLLDDDFLRRVMDGVCMPLGVLICKGIIILLGYFAPTENAIINTIYSYTFFLSLFFFIVTFLYH